MAILATIKTVVERSDTRAGKAFDLLVQAVIIISLVAFSLETLPDLSAQAQRTLRLIEIATVGFFTIEYVTRIIVADNKRAFIFSFFGIVDFLAIAPFYLALGIDLRSLRILRILRLVLLFKLMRYSVAIQRFHTAFQLIKEELLLFAAVSFLVLYLAAVGIYYFEHVAQPDVFSSIFHSLWWAVATLTTVGYGDVYPVTVGGKLFTFVILLIGLGFISVPAGIIASALSKARQLEQDVPSDKDN